MATVNEGLLRFGNWIIFYDLGASALTNSYGNHSAAYRQLTELLTSLGFVMIQQSVYRHAAGCILAHTCAAIVHISGFAWAPGNFQGSPHVREIRIAIQVSPAMVMTTFVQGDPGSSSRTHVIFVMGIVLTCRKDVCHIKLQNKFFIM
ncbi:hypothetical protein RhiirA4_425483 [Rhizophagus irregularis]|uniref:Uncharacterized protein n=1 Tax=Rhizophagus irregularis TaxID=588596 RepID=A0A2I1H1F1_9GLOM|nr:hypothetical protein RhiirA4_425483 [Rhizophagus irregularis]